MADVLLKNAAGQEEPYEDINTITVKTTDGGNATYVSEHLIQNQVQADWNQTDENHPSYIQNKPTVFETENELPDIEVTDEGRFLGIENGKWAIVDAPENGGTGGEGGTELPEVTTEDEGRFLGVENGKWAIVDAPESSGADGAGLPEVSAEDDGMVLGVKDGKWQAIDAEFSGDSSNQTGIIEKDVVIEWNTAKTPTVTFNINELGYTAHKISNAIPTKEQMLSANWSISNYNGSKIYDQTITEDNIAAETAISTMVMLSEPQFVYVICHDVGEVTTSFSGIDITVNCPETGIYQVWSMGDELPSTMFGSISYTITDEVDFIQSNWEQNDFASPEYIKNRPFYVDEPTITEVLPITKLPFNFNENDGIYQLGITATEEQLALWNSDWINVEITWDTDKYICEPQYIMGLKCVGNIDFLLGTGDNKMPFIFIMTGPSDTALTNTNCLILSLYDPVPEDPATAQTIYHDVALSIKSADIITLDPKFLGDVPWEKITDGPFGDIPAGAIAVEENVVSIEDVFGRNAAVGFAVNESNFVVGAKYNVTVNGTTYEGKCIYDADDFEAKIVQWSDGQLSPYIPALGTSAYLPASASIGDLFTIKVVLAEDTVAKIDAKYLPEFEASSALPDFTTSDSGKVLTVDDNGATSWQLPVNELPSASEVGNNKILKTVDGEWVASDETVELPTISEEDNGKILQASDGNWVPAEIAKELPVVSSTDEGKVLRVIGGVWTAAELKNGDEVRY